MIRIFLKKIIVILYDKLSSNEELATYDTFINGL